VTFNRILAATLSLLLSACAGQDGIYEPACVAYEGDIIELKSGRFEWRRFTDERKVDESGKVATPFPGYPKSGTYRVSGGRVLLTGDDQRQLQDWFIADSAGQRYLLTAEQHNVFQNDGVLPECALRFRAIESR